MALYFRKRSRVHVPITLSVTLMSLNVALMVCWIVLLAQDAQWGALAVGVVTFTIIIIGLSFWLALSIKEINLNHRQANFVDSVTHELKSPIAALQLSLQTLRMRHLDEAKRAEFHAMMADELSRLDQLIDQLLEVGRLDAIGSQEAPEPVPIQGLLYRCAEHACAQHKLDVDQVFTFDVPPLTLHARRIVLQLIFSNLIDNAVKYADDPAHVRVAAWRISPDRLRVRIADNGSGVPYEERKKIFRIFYRGGTELERRRKGTGLGLYIVHTLVRRLKGTIDVLDRTDGQRGCVFQVELPGPVSDHSLGERSDASPEAVQLRPAEAAT
ncbi:MAG: HAMP domain-containing sensor histidine kinase [Planctomycetaceae bacterium]